jgi:hypothetical protein
MELPTTKPHESKGHQAKRRRISEEQAWNYGGWAAMALFPVPYALMQTLIQNATGALLATASLLTVTAIVVLRRSEKETFQRGFSIWSVPVHGLAALVFLTKMLQ